MSLFGPSRKKRGEEAILNLAAEGVQAGCSSPSCGERSWSKERASAADSGHDIGARGCAAARDCLRAVGTCVCRRVRTCGSVCPSAVSMTDPTPGGGGGYGGGRRGRNGQEWAGTSVLPRGAKGINTGPGEQEMAF